MPKHTGNKSNSEIRRFTMNNVVPKLQKCWTNIIAFKIISRIVKQQNFFHSQPSTLANQALTKLYISTIFSLSFMISSVAPARSSTSHGYLIIKIGKRDKTLSPQVIKKTNVNSLLP